jgi:hypothetical protein
LLPWILLSDFIPLRKEVMLIWFSLSFFPPLFFFFFDGVGDQTQSLTHARQGLYHWGRSPYLILLLNLLSLAHGPEHGIQNTVPCAWKKENILIRIWINHKGY